MVEVDGKLACCVSPYDVNCPSNAWQQPSLPKAERLTGYHVGGISPFGQKRTVPTAFEITAAKVGTNAGKRALLSGVAPNDVIAALNARQVPHTA